MQAVQQEQEWLCSNETNHILRIVNFEFEFCLTLVL